MEKIEQLIIMYKVHQPGIWTAVREANIQNVQRLLKGTLDIEIVVLYYFSIKGQKRLKLVIIMFETLKNTLKHP